jgi:hypothetical protein
MKYAVEMDSCDFICLQVFMKIGTGFQAILRFYPSSFIGCDVSVTEKIHDTHFEPSTSRTEGRSSLT